MNLRKITALLLGAVIAASASVTAAAEVRPDTVWVEQSLSASADVEWNGKTALEAGKSYVVTKDVTVAKKIVVPKGTKLTIKNGAKLWVNSKGSLYIKGTVLVGKKSKLAVSGKLYQYKSKKLTVSGTVSFGSKSDITLNGKTAINASGEITGKPKKLSVGENATLTGKGKNSCAKLAAAFETDEPVSYEEQIGEWLNTYLTKAIFDGDFYGAYQYAYPENALKALEIQFAEMGMSFKDFCDLISSEYTNALAAEGITKEQLATAKIDFIVSDVKDVTSGLSDDEKDFLVLYGDDAKVYSANIKITVDYDGESNSEDYGEIKLALAGGKWYMFQ